MDHTTEFDKCIDRLSKQRGCSEVVEAAVYVHDTLKLSAEAAKDVLATLGLTGVNAPVEEKVKLTLAIFDRIEARKPSNPASDT